MRLPFVVSAVSVLLSLTSACTPCIRYGYSRDARVTSEYQLVKAPDGAERIEQRGIGPERLRMHLYDPFECNQGSPKARTFYVDLGPECRLMARSDSHLIDTGRWASRDFIQAEARIVEGKPCQLTLDTGTTVSGTVKTGVMVIRPASTTLDVSLAIDDGTLRVSMTGPWQPPREGS